MRDINNETKLTDVHGFGSSSFTVLGTAGYKLTPSSTVGQFKEVTSSFNELKSTLTQSGIEHKYVMPKFQAIWNGGSNKRPREEELTEAHSNRTISNFETATKVARTDPSVNFLLAPTPMPGAVDTSTDPDIVTSVVETPEVKAMDRHAETSATATGNIAATVAPFVIPDQLLDISPEDRDINGPTEQYPENPIPITPAIAIGESVFASRIVPVLSHEQRMDEDLLGEALPSAKANNEKDIGGDGFSSLTEEGEIQQKSESSSSKFTSIPLGAATTPSFDEKENIKPQDARTASRHPFKAASLFRDHDMAATSATIIGASEYNTRRLMLAANSAQENRDSSWYRWNASTEGVNMIEMPIDSTNYLERGPMVTEYQMLGANPFQLAFSPSPFDTNRILGKFGI